MKFANVTWMRPSFVRLRRSVREPIREIAHSSHQQVKPPSDDLFRYTSGRWVYNEHLRLSERYLRFDVTALKHTIATGSGRSVADIISFIKLSEGGFNRIFQAKFRDGGCVIARLPYSSTTPKHYAVASEIATLDFLRLQGIPIPKVYAWSSTQDNPVGCEYIVMEKFDGIPLGELWYSMTPKEQHKVVKQTVELEARIMSLEFPSSGSIYYEKDLHSEARVSLSDPYGNIFCIGPAAHYSWWHGSRRILDINRGPWATSNDVFRAVGERELAWIKAYGKPRLPYERLYRDIYYFSHIPPDGHVKNLEDYLALAPCLGFRDGTSLNRPVLRHPDFQPNNILVSESKEIVGLIDWQHSSILPLCLAAGIPKHFQNYGDPESERLAEPQFDLPPNYDSLPAHEQAQIREISRKRLVHFLYAALTRRLNKEHYDAIFNNSVILHQRLFEGAGTPWEGDSITFRADMIRITQDWQSLVSADSVACENEACSKPPLAYPESQIWEALGIDLRQKEADAAMDQMQNVLGVDALGWVPNDNYDSVKRGAHEIKVRLLEAAETEHDRTAVREHFPFDDFDEDS